MSLLPEGILLPSELVSQYRFMNLPKTDNNIMIELINMMQIPDLDTSSVLPFGQMPRTSNKSHLFWNLEDPVLVQTLCCRRGGKTYHPLNAGCWTYVAFICRSTNRLTAAISLSSCTSESSPTSNKDAELNKQFRFGIDLNKILPDLFKLRTKTEKSYIKFLQHT